MIWQNWFLTGLGSAGLLVLCWAALVSFMRWWQWGKVDPFSEDNENSYHRYSGTPWWSRGHRGRKANDPNRRAYATTEPSENQ